MAGNQNGPNGPGGGLQPVYTDVATQLPAVLQPANVQLGMMVDLLQKLTDKARGANRGVEDLAAGQKKAGEGFGALLGQVRGGVSAATTLAAGAVGTMVAAVSALLGQFVSKFSPAAVTRFERAVDNLMATLGRALLPLLDAVTGGVRWLADTLGGMLAPARELAGPALAALAPLFRAVGAAVRDVVGVAQAALLPAWRAVAGALRDLTPAVAPLVKVLATVAAAALAFQGAVAGAIARLVAAAVPLVTFLVDTFGGLLLAAADLGRELTALAGDALGAAVDLFLALRDALGDLLAPVRDLAVTLVTGVVQAVKDVLGWLRRMVNGFRELLGLRRADRADPDFRGDQAARPASFSGTDELWKKAAAQSFAAGAGAAEKPVNTIMGHTSEIRDLLRNLPAAIARAFADELARGKGLIQNATGGTFQAFARGGASGVAAHLADMWRGQELRRN